MGFISLKRDNIDFFGLKLYLFEDNNSFIEKILSFSSNKTNYVYYLNADTFNKAVKNKIFAKILKKGNLIYPDGMSIVLTLKLMGYKTKRITAADFIGDFLQKCQIQRLKVAFVGGNPGFIKKLKEKIEKNYPDLNIKLFDGYFHKNKEKEKSLLKKLQDFSPQIILLGMGSPLQELWSYKNLGNYKSTIWHIGAAMEFFAGEKRRAPLWMQKCGLEWLHRLVSEPKRLAKRYIIGNPFYIYNIVKFILLKKSL